MKVKYLRNILDNFEDNEEIEFAICMETGKRENVYLGAAEPSENGLYISLQGLKAIISQMDKNIKAKLFGGFLDKVFNAPKEIKHFEIAYNEMAKDEKIQDIKSLAYLIYSAVNSDMAQDKMLYESIKQVTSSLYNNIKNL